MEDRQVRMSIRVGLIAAFALTMASAQTSTGFGNILFPGSPQGSQFGSVLFPGGRPNVFSNPNASFADRVAATVIGSPGYTGAPAPGSRRHRPHVIGVPVPVGFGYGYGYGYGAYEQPQQPITIINQAPQQPPVVIHQTIIQQPDNPADRVRTYTAPGRYDKPAEESPKEAAAQSAPGDPAPRVYLLAFTDGSVRSAVGFWADGGVLHYLTPRNQHNQASLALIDRDTTRAINKRADLDLPPLP